MRHCIALFLSCCATGTLGGGLSLSGLPWYTKRVVMNIGSNLQPVLPPENDLNTSAIAFEPIVYCEIPVKHPPTGFDSLRTLAVARLYLDNFDHITAYWVGLGMNLVQVALNYGADDVHGTIIEEKIFHMAGAGSPQLQTETEMIRAIREAGRVPVQRDTFYRPIREWQEEPLATA